ncbi:unnamed protein product [Cochlearia groenlandica]
MSFPTMEQLHSFHVRDREIFSKLVLNFSRPPAESLLVMATWLWLEDFGFGHILPTIMTLSDPLISAFAKEAVFCFECLASPNPPNGFTRIPLTATFATKEISLKIIYKHRYTAITGIKNFLKTVCSRIFSDILQRVLLSPMSSSFTNSFNHPLTIPGFPHPIFGNINVILPNVVNANENNNNLFSNNLMIFPNGIWGWHPNFTANENERTLFLTFSRGFPVSQWEVKDLFTQRYGENCVKGVYMQEDMRKSLNTNDSRYGQQQSLYARLVMDSVITVDRILEDQNLRKFQINRKDIWARKYEDRP